MQRCCATDANLILEWVANLIYLTLFIIRFRLQGLNMNPASLLDRAVVAIMPDWLMECDLERPLGLVMFYIQES